MKALLAIFSSYLILLPFLGIAQWIYINQGSTCDYNVIKFSNEMEGWAMGDNCCIQKTTDGGTTWMQVECNGIINLQDFYFVNDSVAYCAGWYFDGSVYSEVLKYDLINESWDVIYSTDSTAILALHFHDPLTGFMVSGTGIQKTDNGGLSWNTVWDASYAGFTSAYLEDIIFVTDSIGFACGKMKPELYGQQGILKSTDKGENWFVCYLDPNVASGTVYMLNQANDNPDVIYGSSSKEAILKSIDCGNTWESIDSGIEYEYKPIYFINADTGYAAATFLGYFPGYEYLTMEIWKTTNGAMTWEIQFVDSAYWQATKSIFFINDTVGFVAGWQTMLRTDNGIGTGFHSSERLNDVIINVYPNPANDWVYFGKLNLCKRNIIQLYNLHGRLLKEVKNIQSSHFTMKVADLNAGVYFYVVKQQNEILQQGKLIIK